MQIIKTVNIDEALQFENEVNELIKQGYTIKSVHCACYQCGEYETFDSWMAIAVKSITHEKTSESRKSL